MNAPISKNIYNTHDIDLVDGERLLVLMQGLGPKRFDHAVHLRHQLWGNQRTEKFPVEMEGRSKYQWLSQGKLLVQCRIYSSRGGGGNRDKCGSKTHIFAWRWKVVDKSLSLQQIMHVSVETMHDVGWQKVNFPLFRTWGLVYNSCWQQYVDEAFAPWPILSSLSFSAACALFVSPFSVCVWT